MDVATTDPDTDAETDPVPPETSLIPDTDTDAETDPETETETGTDAETAPFANPSRQALRLRAWSRGRRHRSKSARGKLLKKWRAVVRLDAKRRTIDSVAARGFKPTPPCPAPPCPPDMPEYLRALLSRSSSASKQALSTLISDSTVTTIAMLSHQADNAKRPVGVTLLLVLVVGSL